MLFLHDNQLKSLCQALGNNFLANLLSGQGLTVDSATLGIVQVDIIRQQCVIRDHIVIVQRTLVREVIGGDGQAGGYGETLPVDA